MKEIWMLHMRSSIECIELARSNHNHLSNGWFFCPSTIRARLNESYIIKAPQKLDIFSLTFGVQFIWIGRTIFKNYLIWFTLLFENFKQSQFLFCFSIRDGINKRRITALNPWMARIIKIVEQILFRLHIPK